MSPHVSGEGSGQRVERESLDPVIQLRLTQHGKRLLQRCHRLDHGASLGAAVGRASTEDFIGAEESIGLRLVGVEHVQSQRHRRVAVGRRAAEAVIHCWPGERPLGVVHAMVVGIPPTDRAQGEFDGAGTVVVGEPIHPLGAEEPRRVEQQRRGRLPPEGHDVGVAAERRHEVINHVHGHLDVGGPPRARPLVDGVCPDELGLLGQMSDDGACDRPAGGGLCFRVHEQRAQHVERIPQPVPVAVARLVRPWADPPVGFVRVGQYVGDHAVNNGAKLRRWVQARHGRRPCCTQEHQQRHVSIGPIGQPLCCAIRHLSTGPH